MKWKRFLLQRNQLLFLDFYDSASGCLRNQLVYICIKFGNLMQEIWKGHLKVFRKGAQILRNWWGSFTGKLSCFSKFSCDMKEWKPIYSYLLIEMPASVSFCLTRQLIIDDYVIKFTLGIRLARACIVIRHLFLVLTRKTGYSNGTFRELW